MHSMQTLVSTLLDSNFSGPCPSHRLNVRDIFLGKAVSEGKAGKGKSKL
jgi:hypothetical protein